MRTLLILFFSLLINYQLLFAQYDEGTTIYSENNTAAIQKNYKVVDFNKDNFVDILFIKDRNTNQLTWFKGDESGNFSEQKKLLEVDDNHKENEIFYTDMNGDGIEDIVFQNSNTGFITLLNDGQGNIADRKENKITIDNLVRAELKSLADINGDGNTDGIFFIQKDNDRDWAYEKRYGVIGYNNGVGVFNNYEYLQNKPAYLMQVKAGDINGDGYIDMVCNGQIDVEEATEEGTRGVLIPFIKVFQNSENGFLQELDIELPTVKNKSANLVLMKLEDINNDNVAELLTEFAFIVCEGPLHEEICTHTYKFQTHHYNLSEQTFVTTHTYNSSPHGYRIPNSWGLYELIDDAFQIQFGQHNEDDNLDMLSVTVPQGKLQWNIGNGKGGFVAKQNEVVHTNNEYNKHKPALRVADVDNDSDLDVFVLLNTETSSTLTLFKNLVQAADDLDEPSDSIVNQSIISPNPVLADSFIQFNFDKEENSPPINYSLYSLQGAKISDGFIDWGRIYIPNLNTGMYLIKIDLPDTKYIDKLIIH